MALLALRGLADTGSRDPLPELDEVLAPLRRCRAWLLRTYADLHLTPVEIEGLVRGASLAAVSGRRVRRVIRVRATVREWRRVGRVIESWKVQRARAVR